MLPKNDSIYIGDCLDVLSTFDADMIDLVVTSPPYDNLRTYNGFSFDYKEIAKQLYRVCKDGGVVVWVIADATINGSETGTSFEHALFFKQIGFNIHDTMIYLKDQLAYPTNNRYYGAFEYMFVFSKGKPKTVHLIKDRMNKSFGRVIHGKDRQSDGSFKEKSRRGLKIDKYGVRWNYWLMYNQKRGFKHPACFPEDLARDHIVSWSNIGDLVLDPFAGSGTTLKVARDNGRHYIGIEISKDYVDVIKQRLK
jgi:DNA modification methylase